ncbi:hypothetical protein HanIR_Chr12g0575381 [Helianthus annuus]|nr:hypothetical protein HanIR_Chr12g0575381 [Helianthus annuus]
MPTYPSLTRKLSMQIFRQLPSFEYTSIIDVIANKHPFATFLEVEIMLLHHESREGLFEPRNHGLQNATTAITQTRLAITPILKEIVKIIKPIIGMWGFQGHYYS